MADFDWSFTPATLLLAANLVTVLGGGTLWYRKQIGFGMQVDNTQKFQDLATKTVERLDERNIALENKLEKEREQRDELASELVTVREYLLRDAAWHVQVLALMESLGEHERIQPAPILPPRRRDISNGSEESI